MKLFAHIRYSILILTAVIMAFGPFVEAIAATPAKQLFGAKTMPAALKPASHGFYSKGCLAGAVAMPIDGPTWQVMRLSRNRRWGHPNLIATIEKLSVKAKKDGWNGLLVGDISQPRGGPMLTGHRSHQIGLDSDLWLMPMPHKRMTYSERENTSAISVLKKGTPYVDDRRWTKAHERLLYHAANFRDVERLLVHPGIKKKLCDTVIGDRRWLEKVRPFYGHHYHFHVRMGCQKGSPYCKKQNPTPGVEGCGKNLKWWFEVALAPKKKKKKTSDKTAKKKKKKKITVLSNLPNACRTVLEANSKSKQQAIFKATTLSGFAAPKLDLPTKIDPLAVLSSKPIEASASKNLTNIGSFYPLITGEIPLPTPRPVK